MKNDAVECKLGITVDTAREDAKRLGNASFRAAYARVTSFLEAQGFSREAGRVSLVNPRGTVRLISSVPRRIPQLCSSSAKQTKRNVMRGKNW